MNIYGEKVFLRAVEKEDMDAYLNVINDPEVAHTIVGTHFPISKYQQNKWYESNPNGISSLKLTIVLQETNEAVGSISIEDIDWKNRSAGRGIKLFKTKNRHKGIATDSIMALSQYAFEELNLHRFSLNILSYNEVSQKLAIKCGAKKEGVMRKAVFRSGEYHDVFCYGVLREDFLEAKAKMNWEPKYLVKDAE